MVHIHKAAQQGVRQWGRDAAIRFLMNRCGYNLNTARRCLTIALQCTIIDSAILDN